MISKRDRVFNKSFVFTRFKLNGILDFFLAAHSLHGAKQQYHKESDIKDFRSTQEALIFVLLNVQMP